ncbi:MAG: CDP-alcohol phosphatidyltransferase family protein [Pseudomonadota bacterium]
MWTIPNLLTVARIAAAPVVALLVVFGGDAGAIAALVLFVVAALTDFLDGWIARRFDQMSRLGAMLDPIADKAMAILVLAALIASTAPGTVPGTVQMGDGLWTVTQPHALALAIPALLIMLREVLVSGLREYLAGVPLAVTRLAKWKTTAQLVAIAVLLLAEAWPALRGADPRDYAASLAILGEAADFRLGGIALLWLAAGLTIVSGLDYFRKAWPHLSAPPASED